jgi:hypothetical protein
VLIDHDGGVAEGWFTVDSDGVVKLCDLSGHPYRVANLMHRLALGEDEGRVAKIRLRRRVTKRDGGFTRTLNYPPSGLA